MKILQICYFFYLLLFKNSLISKLENALERVKILLKIIINFNPSIMSYMTDAFDTPLFNFLKVRYMSLKN